MRFLCDENFPVQVLIGLRESGHDVVHVSGEFAGLDDPGVLAKAIEEKRILLTFDKDFGQLREERDFAKKAGVILFRLPTRPTTTLTSRILKILASRDDWEGTLSVVEPARVRRRP